MAHYQAQFEKDRQKQAQRQAYLFYKNKVRGLNTVINMIQQELTEIPFDENKINNMLDQINCLSERD